MLGSCIARVYYYFHSNKNIQFGIFALWKTKSNTFTERIPKISTDQKTNSTSLVGPQNNRQYECERAVHNLDTNVYYYYFYFNRLSSEQSSIPENVLNSFPVERIPSDNHRLTKSDKKCGVCFHGYRPSQAVRRLPCKHEV